jgi:glucose/arabinose dehydrogenase
MSPLLRSCALILLVLLAQRAAAAVPSGFSDATWVSGIGSPTAMTFMPDGRALVCQQTGALRVIKNGSLLTTPMVSLTVDASGERGLLGVAVDPQFGSNSWIYLYYTARTPAVHNRLSRFTVSGDVVVGGSEVVLLDLDNLSGATNHNGGAIHFGPDGKLYVAVGDNANSGNAQTLANLLGKILRLNKDGSIPSDNPFYGSASGNNRAIWALGLRNPFTFGFRPGSSLMYLNDVGQSSWEEINQGVAGANYGWPATEGATSNPAYRSPLYSYPHGSGNFAGCAITGGVFYNPATVQFPGSYVGKYFFADYCNAWINTYDPATGTVANFANGISSAVNLAVGADGSLYYLARGQSAVRRISYSVAPIITQHPQSVSVASGGSATFTVAASGSPAPTFRWQRNGVDISGATGAQYTLGNVSSADNGASFRAIASNSAGSATSNSATLTVTGANTPPTATITMPAAGTTYAGGTTIFYAGTGNDPQDGALPGSRFTWRVDFHHDNHVHPFIAETSGATSGSFTIPGYPVRQRPTSSTASSCA